MGKVSEKHQSKSVNDFINDIYENSLQNMTSVIKKSKQTMEEEDEEIKIGELEIYVQNHMKEFRKLVKEVKNANTLTSNALRDYHCTLMRCEEQHKQLDSNEAHTEINNTLNGIVIEINNACKSVYL